MNQATVFSLFYMLITTGFHEDEFGEHNRTLNTVNITINVTYFCHVQ